jgi:class 3 adenylate cyclase
MLRSLAAGLALAAVRSVDAARASGLVLQRRVLEHYLPPPAMRVLLGRDPAPATIERVRLASVAVRLAGVDALATRLTPEAMTALLREFYALCEAAVRDHGGTLECYEADRVRAIFAATSGAAHEAVRAARTAIAIQQALALYRSTQADGANVGDVAAGIASGFGHVARIERGSRTTTHGLGATATLAERLCQQAEGGEVIADPTAAAAVASTLSTIALGAIDMPGITERVEVFAVGERVAA